MKKNITIEDVFSGKVKLKSWVYYLIMLILLVIIYIILPEDSVKINEQKVVEIKTVINEDEGINSKNNVSKTVINNKDTGIKTVINEDEGINSEKNVLKTVINNKDTEIKTPYVEAYKGRVKNLRKEYLSCKKKNEEFFQCDYHLNPLKEDKAQFIIKWQSIKTPHKDTRSKIITISRGYERIFDYRKRDGRIGDWKITIIKNGEEVFSEVIKIN